MKTPPQPLRLAAVVVWLLTVTLLAGRFTHPLPVQAGVWTGIEGAPPGTPPAKAVFSKHVTVCFVGDAATARPDRVRQIADYIKHFEHAANIRFVTLAGKSVTEEAALNITGLTCPPPATQSNGYDAFAGDIRVVIPGTSVNALTPIPGNGCDTDRLNSDPDAASWGPDRIDVVWRDAENTLRLKFWDEEYGGWSGANKMTQHVGGHAISSGPTVATWGENRLDIFARGMDGALWHTWYDGDWHGWESLGGTLAADSDPDAVSWGPNRLDVFVRWADNSLRHIFWSGSAWSGWENLGGVISSGPGVASRGANRLDVFVRGMDYAVWHRAWDGSAWSGWTSIGGIVDSAPDAVSWGANRIDVFVRGQNGRLWTNSWTGSGWTGWGDTGAASDTGPGVTSRGENRLDVFGRGSSTALSHQAFEGGVWSAWNDIGDNYHWGSWAGPPWAVDIPNSRACLYNLKLGDDPWNDDTPYLNHTLHEFGHALGLIHEHERSDARAAIPGCTANNFGGRWATGFLTPYDRNSVMNYHITLEGCGIQGNYAWTGLSDWDKLSLHILYPEDERVAEYVGTTVLRAGTTLRLESAWQARGANMSVAAKAFAWTLNGGTVSTTTNLVRAMNTPGTYHLGFTHQDLLGRQYSTTGVVRVLDAAGYNNLAGAVSAATSAALAPVP